MNQVLSFIASMQLSDLVDILVVTGLIYVVLTVLRETRSQAAMLGLLGVVATGFMVYIIARLMQLTTTMLIFENFWIVIILFFLIVFQNDFRKALTDIGQMRAVRRLFSSGGAYIDELVAAARSFSRSKIGALICIERRNPLTIYANTGTTLEGRISNELLRTIFVTYSPLHDGAVIIRGDRILAAGCLLPLSARTDLGDDLGTRHRAGLGVSEETDAVVVIVSEETGIISLAAGGKLERNHTPESLREALAELLSLDRGEDNGKD